MIGEVVHDLVIPSSSKQYAFANPAYIFAICDGYLFSYGQYPIKIGYVSLADNDASFYVTGKRSFYKFETMAGLRRPDVENVLKYHINMREVESVTPSEIEKLSVFADTTQGKILKFRTKVGNILAGSGCVALVVSFAWTSYEVFQMNLQALAIIAIIIGSLLMTGKAVRKTSNYQPNAIRIGRRIDQSDF